MKLYEHQERALKDTENLNRVAYFHDMGLGKTFTGAEKMFRLNNDINLLICQKSKIKDWIEHFKIHYPKAEIVDLTVKGAVDKFVSRFNAWHGFSGASFTVGIINYELCWRRPALLNVKDFTLMLDESSLIQNKTAKQTKFILNLQPANVILLSGTPTAGKYENLWTQAHLLGWDISNTLYQKQYVNWKNLNIGWGQNARTIKVVDKENPYKNVERLKSKLREHGACFLKTEEVLNLPEQNFIEVNVPKSKEYDRFMKDLIIAIDGNELIGDTSLTKRLYAREICGQYSEAKLQALKDLIESTNDRLIVFYNFTAELEMLMNVVNERPISIVNGQIKDLSAYETEDNSIIFCQYQAAAMGLNLQKANKIIYFSLPERSELFEQSKKRIHRIGQTKPCFYYVMMCENTIERNIYDALKMRKDYTDYLFIENL